MTFSVNVSSVVWFSPTGALSYLFCLFLHGLVYFCLPKATNLAALLTFTFSLFSFFSLSSLFSLSLLPLIYSINYELRWYIKIYAFLVLSSLPSNTSSLSTTSI